MSTAMVKVYNAARPTQFRTDFNQFMKSAMNQQRIILPANLTLDNGAGKISFKPQMPKKLWETLESDDKVYFIVWLKDDANVIRYGVCNCEMSDLSGNVVIGGEDYKQASVALTVTISYEDMTIDKTYDVNLGFSAMEINGEVAENPGDVPFTAYGEVCLATYEVTNTET